MASRPGILRKTQCTPPSDFRMYQKRSTKKIPATTRTLNLLQSKKFTDERTGPEISESGDGAAGRSQPPCARRTRSQEVRCRSGGVQETSPLPPPSLGVSPPLSGNAEAE